MAPKKRLDSAKITAKLRETKKECEQRRRDKIKNDPEKYEEFKRKERERYHKRKEAGKIKDVSQLSDRDKRALRKNWVQKKRKSRLRKAQENVLLHENTPPNSENDQGAEINQIENIPVIGRAGSSRQDCGKKVAKRNKSRAYREIKRLKEELERERKKRQKMIRNKERYKKKYYRLKEKNKNINSPRQKVNRLLEGEKVSPKVRRALEFNAALTTQIEDNYMKNQESNKSKTAFAMVLAGKIIKKYRCLRKLPLGSYSKQLSKINGRHTTTKSVSDCLLTRAKYITKNDRVRDDVVRFFEQDDVSRMEPGLKDCVTKKQIKKQKRTLMGNMKSLQNKFEVEYGYEIPYSNFCKYRPFWVVLPHVTKRNTCACEKHENFSLLFEKLKKLKVINYQDPDHMIKSICCQNAENNKEECLEGRCQKCSGNGFEINSIENITTNVEQWKRKDVKFEVKGVEKTAKKIVKESIEIELKDLVNQLYDALPKYMIHVSNIIHQYRSIFNLKKGMTSKDIIIHVDFSQNYDCKYAKEVQSVHFGGSREQCTLHTGVMYYKKNDGCEKPTVFSFSSLSQSLRHDPCAVVAHLKPVLEHAKTLVQDIEKIHFVSDSPTTQYRNKTLFYLISSYLNKYCSKAVTWNYSECGHGKGAPDGIGGALKRTANRLVAEGIDLPTFQCLFDALKKSSKIELFLVTEDDIKMIDGVLMDNIPPFPGTMRVHQVLWTSEDKERLEIRRLSCFDCPAATKCTDYHMGYFSPLTPSMLKKKQIYAKSRLNYKDVYSDSDDDNSNNPQSCSKTTDNVSFSDLNVHDWCFVKYENELFPGEILKISSPNVIEVTCMVKAGQYWKWPCKPDTLNYSIKDIKCKLTPPIVVNSRGHYKFL